MKKYRKKKNEDSWQYWHGWGLISLAIMLLLFWFIIIMGEYFADKHGINRHSLMKKSQTIREQEER
ncbi:MAG: hypothetical protein ABIE43_01230 [Patescibacteria group bacterium]